MAISMRNYNNNNNAVPQTTTTTRIVYHVCVYFPAFDRGGASAGARAAPELQQNQKPKKKMGVRPREH